MNLEFLVRQGCFLNFSRAFNIKDWGLFVVCTGNSSSLIATPLCHQTLSSDGRV